MTSQADFSNSSLAFEGSGFSKAPLLPATPFTSPIASANDTHDLDPRTMLSAIGGVVYDWDIVSDVIQFGANHSDVLPDICEAGRDGTRNSNMAQMRGTAYASLVSPASLSSRDREIFGATERDTGSGVPYMVHYHLITKQGKQLYVEDTGRWFADELGQPVRAHGMVRVLSSERERRSHRDYASRFDAMTGLPNRLALHEHLTNMLRDGAHKNSSFAALMVEIADLADINRDYGYEVTDALLVQLVKKLRSNMRSIDTMARYVGGKFVILLDSCDGKLAERVANRFARLVESSLFDTPQGSIALSLRIGAVIAPAQANTAQMVLHCAEEALNQLTSKAQAQALDSASGQTSSAAADTYACYNKLSAHANATTRIRDISAQIISALNERRLVLAYQPIVYAKASQMNGVKESGEIAYYEALMRIVDQDGSLIGPSTLLQVAEKTGLIKMVDTRVLELATARMIAEPNLCLAVNVSGLTLHDPEWPELLARILNQDTTLASRLILEIVETTIINDVETTAKILESIRAFGVRIAMDDFGAGYTSFRNLRKLSVDVLKIDGAFIQNIVRSQDDQFFVQTLVKLARHLGIPVVAEWVESAEAAKYLADWGVDYLQGYYFGKADVPKMAMGSELPRLQRVAE